MIYQGVLSAISTSHIGKREETLSFKIFVEFLDKSDRSITFVHRFHQ